ncbi:MAG: hydroxymethylpyrimidine transporter CytX [Phormidesmis priestleyi Ana]|uniref:Hydroxymethylpyrimidine transporter CytX n=1 Tax=Phormidesmis priestleyi Ana TaxID=1666911 RepID=A0A0P7ZNL2_9CYAN|nr:MAG: hydroxymethylpyrimidine transporter CytX [Phormidesmis priestleyi Ana]
MWFRLCYSFGDGFKEKIMTNVIENAALNKVPSADRSAWPLMPSERNWSQRQLFVVLLVSAAATWCYIIGEYVGYYLNLKPGFASMTAGSLVGMFLVTVAVVPMATRFGIDSVATTKAQFGSRGWMFAGALQYISIIGWNSLLLIFFGKSVAQLLITLGLLPEGGAGFVVPLMAALACAVVYGTLLKGATGVERISNTLFFFIVGVSVWMVVMLLTKESGAIAAATPEYASDKLWDYTTGMEIGIVSLLSWWPYIGAMVRVVPNASKATLPSMLGMGLPVPLISVVGLAAFLAVGTSDPSTWLVSLGGPLFGSIALLFVIAANLGTAVIGVYASAVGLRHLPVMNSLPWKWVLSLSIMPVAAVGIAIPDAFFNNFGTFLAFIGVMFAPLCGIQIADYFFLRRQSISIRALYDPGSEAPYYFWRGFNPAAFLAMAIGFGVYVYLLDPVAYTSRAPYQYLTASLPTCLVGGLSYVLFTLLVNKPLGLGGYENGYEK